MRRPEPLRARNIGVWYNVFEVMAMVAVITNAALVCFTSNHFTEHPFIRRFSRLGIFIAVEHVVLVCKFGLATIVPALPAQVALQQQRAAHFVSTLWRLEPSTVEDAGEVLETDNADGPGKDDPAAAQLGEHADAVHDGDEDVWKPDEELAVEAAENAMTLFEDAPDEGSDAAAITTTPVSRTRRSHGTKAETKRTAELLFAPDSDVDSGAKPLSAEEQADIMGAVISRPKPRTRKSRRAERASNDEEPKARVVV
jgi:hypothetical protein